MLIVGMVILYERGRTSRRPQATIAWIVVVAVAVIVAGFPLQQTYLRDRYVSSAGNELPSFASWFQHENNIRIGVIGQFSYLQYPFYGKTLSNYVQYLGVRGPHGTYSTFGSCKRVATGNRKRALFLRPHHDQRGEYEVCTLLGCATGDEMDGIRYGLEGNPSQVSLRTAPPLPGYLGYSLYKVGSRFTSDGCRGITQS